MVKKLTAKDKEVIAQTCREAATIIWSPETVHPASYVLDVTTRLRTIAENLTPGPKEGLVKKKG